MRSLQIFPADELAEFMGCTADQFLALTRLRWYAWYHGGIPNNEEFLAQLQKNLLCVSTRKFRKMWPFLISFFTENDGTLRFTLDEKRRIESEERIAKSQEAGRLGAEKRWNHKRGVSKTDDSHPMFSNIAPIPSHPNLPHTEAATADRTTGIVELSHAVAAADAQTTESIERKPPTRQDTEFPEAQKLIASCKKFSDVTPDFVEKLANLARAVDPDLDDGRLCEAIRATFKREKQESAGLWLHTVPAWLQNRRRAASA